MGGHWDKCDFTHLIAQLREERDHSINVNGAITSAGQHCKADTSLPSWGFCPLTKEQGGGFGHFLRVRKKLHLNPPVSRRVPSSSKPKFFI